MKPLHWNMVQLGPVTHRSTIFISNPVSLYSGYDGKGKNVGGSRGLGSH